MSKLKKILILCLAGPTAAITAVIALLPFIIFSLLFNRVDAVLLHVTVLIISVPLFALAIFIATCFTEYAYKVFTKDKS
jgi:hypothetical protein